MKEQATESLKKEYQTPELQHFGSVTELTNSAISSCMDDSDGNDCGPVGDMAMGIDG